MDCPSCMIEGFVDELPPNVSGNLPSQELVGFPKPPQGYTPYMKSECNYAAQPCIYSAQGDLVCPKEGLGNCGGSATQKGSGFFGMF